MRLNYRFDFVRLGSVEINALSRVTELDSGLITEPDMCKLLDDGSANISFAQTSLRAIEEQLAIIVPCMNEAYPILEGVLRGIPHHCLVILVSNSRAENFEVERTMMTDFCMGTQRQGIVIHQQDADLARAFYAAGMPHIINNKSDPKSRHSAGRIRNGKGEAMMIGTALAKLAGKPFVGFIDADNFVPGAVHEYCKVFAAGLHHALHPQPPSTSSIDSAAEERLLAMVRIKWKSKPKIVDGKLIPKESGRCSQIVNEWMNHLLTSITGDESHMNWIRTANAGEHAMSTDLALKLNFATGYAVEPFQLINLWERSGVIAPTPASTPPNREAANPQPVAPVSQSREVKILQVETLNPHIHDFGKGKDHIARMQAQGLGTICDSQLIQREMKEELHRYINATLEPVVRKGGALEEARVYPPMEDMDFRIFGDLLSQSGIRTNTDKL